MSGLEDIQYLVGSTHRVELLSILSRRPSRPSEIADRQSAARTTIQRLLAGFAERGWVAKHDGVYRTTVTGDRVLEGYHRLESAVETAFTYRRFAADIGRGEIAVPAETICGTSITRATDCHPLAPVERYVELVSETDIEHFRGIVPVASTVLRGAYDPLVESGTRIELLVDRAVHERVEEQVKDFARFDPDCPSPVLYVHPESVRFGLSIFDSAVCIGSYDVRGNCTALVEAPDGGLEGWAGETFAEYRAQAERIERP